MSFSPPDTFNDRPVVGAAKYETARLAPGTPDGTYAIAVQGTAAYSVHTVARVPEHGEWVEGPIVRPRMGLNRAVALHEVMHRAAGPQ
jgi:hypothetical protein